MADEEKPNMMQQTMGFLKNLYLQNKDEIDRTAKEFYSKRNELTCIDLLEELRQQIWDITSKHLDSQRYALIRKADVLDIINQHLSDMQQNMIVTQSVSMDCKKTLGIVPIIPRQIANIIHCKNCGAPLRSRIGACDFCGGWNEVEW